MSGSKRQKTARRAPAGTARPPALQQGFQVALTHLGAGRLAEADRTCQQLLAADPGFTEALHLRAIVSMRAGRIDRAVAMLQEVLKARPGDPQVLSDLGMILTETGRAAQAVPILERAIRTDPKLATARVNMGNALSTLGKPLPAIEHYRAALKADPAMVTAHNNLSRTYLVLGQVDAAVQSARDAIAHDPDNALAHSHLGAALGRLGHTDQARAAHARARALAPNDESIALAQLRWLTNIGAAEDAMALARSLLQANPASANAWSHLASLKRFSENDPERDRMQAIFDSGQLSDTDRARLGFALGKALEDTGRHAEAFERFDAANALIHKMLPHAQAGTDAMFADIEAAFDASAFARLSGSGDPDPTPVFVVGMPRSGTSLTEQILSSHPDIVGAEELSTLNILARRLRTKTGAQNLREAMARTGPALLKTLGADYIAQLRSFSSTARFIVDKMPANFMFVGLIRLILPNAKIVHIRRDPVDTCLSIYKNVFNPGALSFAYDTADLAHYYRHYDALMRYWDEVLPGFVHTIRYEDLVADQAGQSRALISYLGLDWSDAVLEFHKTDRPVHTASLAQVRRPIYNSSVGLNRKYGDALTPLRTALGPDLAGEVN